MYRRVREYIRRYGMLEQGDRIIAGVSGGADSICLTLKTALYCVTKKQRVCQC